MPLDLLRIAGAILRGAEGAIAGKSPHSPAFQPGGLTRAPGISERIQLFALASEFAAFAEAAWFGARNGGRPPSSPRTVS